MNEPLFWNPLPYAAEYLSKKTGVEIDVQRLIDIVIQRGKMGDPTPTVIKAVCPPDRQWASFVLRGDANAELLGRAPRTDVGDIPTGLIFVKWEYPTAVALCTNHLISILLHGYVDLMHDVKSGNVVWIIPFGKAHRATPDTCGINRADLGALAASIQPAQPTEQLSLETHKEERDTENAWIAVARQYANELWRHRSKNTNPSARDISESIAKRFKEEGIHGSRGTLAATTIERQALRGWKKPTT